MKTAKKSLSIFLAVVMCLSICTCAFAADSSTSLTARFLSQVSASKKLAGTVTSFSYKSGAVVNPIKFKFYDDFSTNAIAVDFMDKPIKVVYANKKISCQLLWFLRFSVSAEEFPLAAGLFGALDSFQTLFKKFVDDPSLSSFNYEASVISKNGESLTSEKFTMPVVGAYGTFNYDSNGSLREIILTDNQGEYIALTLTDVGTTLDSAVFAEPAGLDLSIIWKVLYALFLGKALLA